MSFNVKRMGHTFRRLLAEQSLSEAVRAGDCVLYIRSSWLAMHQMRTEPMSSVVVVLNLA